MQKERAEILIAEVFSCPDSLRLPGSQFELPHFLAADLGRCLHFSVTWSLTCKVKLSLHFLGLLCGLNEVLYTRLSGASWSISRGRWVVPALCRCHGCRGPCSVKPGKVSSSSLLRSTWFTLQIIWEGGLEQSTPFWDSLSIPVFVSLVKKPQAILVKPEEKHGLESQSLTLSYCSTSFIICVNLGKSLNLSEP